jgi:hypothetical protein
LRRGVDFVQRRSHLSVKHAHTHTKRKKEKNRRGCEYSAAATDGSVGYSRFTGQSWIL